MRAACAASAWARRHDHGNRPELFVKIGRTDLITKKFVFFTGTKNCRRFGRRKLHSPVGDLISGVSTRQRRVRTRDDADGAFFFFSFLFFKGSD